MTDMQTSVQESHHADDAAAPVRLSGPGQGGRGARTVHAINLIPTIQSQVIPRLHAALQNSLHAPRCTLTNERALSTATLVAESEIAALADRLLASDQKGVCDRVDALRLEGRSLESIYLNVFAPAACRLRDLWSDDFCGLADVTLALCTLQSTLRHFATAFYAEVAKIETGMRALLVSPSEKRSHVALPTFGLLLMSEFFRREGWDAWIERDLTSGGFRGAVVGEWFDLVEVLATSDEQLDEITSGIRAIRRGSPNPAIGVIVCGQVFIDHPEFVRLVGADLMAVDPLSSLSQAKTYVKRQAQRKRLS
jgi:hypothetical protein